MQVILHNDDVLKGIDGVQAFAEEELRKALHGKVERLTRVEIWVADENGPKAGPDDKRCSMEAHPRGRRPVGVKHHAGDVKAAIKGAARKLARALEKELR